MIYFNSGSVVPESMFLTDVPFLSLGANEKIGCEGKEKYR